MLPSCRMGRLALLILAAMVSPAAAQITDPFDHIHLAVPDVEGARDWYIQNMGGMPGETADSVSWAPWPGDHPLPIQLLFSITATPRPSAGSAIDHVGFSFADLEAKVAALRLANVKIVTPLTDAPGIGRHAVAEDPWGTKLLLVQDPDVLGLHHVELRVPDPETTLAWYAKAFGGERTKYRGTVDVVRYRDLGLFYLFATKDPTAEPTDGHVIDHIGFGPIDLDRTVKTLTAAGATFTSNPNPRLNPACRLVADERDMPAGVRKLYCAPPPQIAHRTVDLEGPGGIRIELVQHLEAGGH
jgi:catechol 2,3-dioxygenase-like lactoylglutathione lyase family enzyme